ncbi:MAG: sigma factor-like helix-turn-helix DNA-binding protein [Eubacteriales bacterium]|nr:sigma factor-like helix-turn-helix DNA-binding protein [Eubacteriales bacterium]
MLELVEHTLLYDFYGELLTEHQRRIYEMVVFEDCSISEVAREVGVSRQGVHDMVKRCNKTLENYESRLRLVERFWRIRDQIHELQQSVAAQTEIPQSVADRLVTQLGAVMEEM